MTYAYAILTVSKATFDEILAKLKAAEYHHAFDEDDGVITIDMHGIALREEPR